MTGAAAAMATAASVSLLAAGCGATGGSGYQVRAIFDDAGNVISGEDVKVAGVVVGKVGRLSVTPSQKAAVVLDITNSGFADFRADASCIVRPQSLIGEKFVECSPTQPRAVGAPEPGPLPVIAHGQPGAGEHLLPVTQTSSPVDLDLVGDVLRLPYRQRLSILINELGAGLAGQGGNLRAVIHRADPALQETDAVLALLASENTTLARLAADSDAAVAPLAAHSAQVADWITQTNKVAVATALRRTALDRSLADLPAFLAQLTPTLTQLGALSEQSTPVLTDLAGAAPQIDQAVTHLAPFAQASTPFLTSLGQTAQQSIPAVQASQPVAAQLASLGAATQPFAHGAATLLSSLRSTGGLERLLDFVFLGAAATNGYDSLGHYLRAALVVNPCSTYATTAAIGCDANYINTAATASRARVASAAHSARASGAAAAPTSGAAADPSLQRVAAVLHGATPAAALREFPDTASSQSGAAGHLLQYLLGP